MKVSGKQIAAFLLHVILSHFSTVTADSGNHFIRTITNVAREDIVTSVMVNSEVACVLSCLLSAACQIPASKTKDIHNNKVQDDLECLHLDQSKTSKEEKKISVTIFTVHSLTGISM